MNDWEEKLNTLLSDPDAMSQVVNMAQTISQQMGGGSPNSGGESAKAPPPTNCGNSASPFDGIDPELIARLIPVVQQMNRPESSETAAFLYALRPFLKPSRRDKVDRAVQLARMIHLAKTFLNTREG